MSSPVNPGDSDPEDLADLAGEHVDDDVPGPGEVVDLADEDGPTWRPSLVKLSTDVREMRQDLLSGFQSVTEILWWLQRLSVRTLGQLPQSLFHRFGRQVRVNVSGQSPVVRALLVPARRECVEDEILTYERTTETRERFAARFVAPAFEEAFRDLRTDSTEYVDDSDRDASGDAPDHDPMRQRHTAMRPALDELERYQRRALGSVLGESSDLQERGDILGWLEALALATHGEAVRVLSDGSVSKLEDFGERCYRERETARLLLSGPEHRAARELFAARFLLPAFNRGVAVLAGRAGELPDAEREERTVPMG